ncbi:hypothetical protein BP6252_11996 [Coleophoma cylindrospora]|uniref:Zn(2)-C6 fungal-type domain-containing protein n=1 Tax=Coleophoma cylindrospora TaxID=1849047 RepID=A0A3D8QFK9_9HELO|nr:hypothetical protein BP6252_11996 [Coleophoma cylindrospora]
MTDMSTEILPTNAREKSPADPPRARLAQRRPLACQACTKSKVRCDKIIPCGRCHKRGIQCNREDVVLSALSSRRRKRRHSHSELHLQHSAETWSAMPSPGEHRESRDRHYHDEHFGNSQPPEKTLNIYPQIRPQSEYVAFQQQNNHLNIERDFHRNVRSPIATVPATTPRYLQNASKGAGKAWQSRPLVQPEFEDLATGIEGLAWGRHQCHRYPHKTCIQIENSCETRRDVPISDIFLERLPDSTVARELVDFHIRYLFWNHNVLHVPTFRHQCETFWSSGAVEDGQWLALYCAILSSATWSVQTCPGYLENVGQVQFTHSASELFDMAIDALNDHNFMSRHTVFSLQAVCISGMVGNVIGKSDLLTTLVSACIRIAQCLGLHRILDEDKDDTWDEVVEKEVGRRVWWKLVEIDYHSMPYTGTCCINLRQFTTRTPLNCNDEDLQEQDESCPTTSTYSIIMAKIALLIPDLLDGICTIDDIAKRYEHVIDVDRRMRQVVAKIPPIFLRNRNAEATHEAEWMTVARRTLAIAAADKVCVFPTAYTSTSDSSI